MNQPLTREKLNELAEKQLKGTINPAERELLDQWYDTDSTEPILWTGADLSEEELSARLLNNIKESRHQSRSFPKRKWQISAAAVALITLSVGIYTYVNQPSAADKHAMMLSQAGMHIPAGRNMATLTLANGKTITLSDSKKGVVINTSKLTYSDGTSITSSGAAVTTQASGNEMLAIATPRGGTYQIILPDGTKAWLNAASVLKFPARFTNLKQRKVELSGEAYFEVTKNKQHPFLVKTTGQEVEVLGTHFNVSSYADDESTKTTLLEGSVRVTPSSQTLTKTTLPSHEEKNSLTLIPGQQSVLQGASLQIKPANINLETAWKNGEFMFRNEPLESIMKKVARWYDVEVIYQNTQVKKERFGGSISRFGNVSDVLQMLELTGFAHFKIEGRRIIVMK